VTIREVPRSRIVGGETCSDVEKLDEMRAYKVGGVTVLQCNIRSLVVKCGLFRMLKSDILLTT